MIEEFIARHYHVAFIVVLAIGLYMLIESGNLVKKVIGLNIFQMSVFLFFTTAAYVEGGGPALVGPESVPGEHSNPLPHVLILTAIVVGVSLTSLALALVVRVYREYGTLDEDRLEEVMAGEP